ncbi:MAG: glycoside hydrolase family 13 protein [Bacteroidota bacterium]|nr:glycoside hydrolase family 13 protein [Bacteroidota bacterium]
MNYRPTLTALILFLITFTGINASEKITIKKLEPANWWVGMKNPELQLLVYGNNISATDARINIPGVSLKSTIKVENKNYLFLNLFISDQAKVGNYTLDFIKDNKVVTSTKFELWERGQNILGRKSFDASDAIYLLMPDRFSNGNPANDSAIGVSEEPDRKSPDGRHGGDIQGIINHLDYLQNLGITALWSTPLMEDNMGKTSYHTYAITDYYRIDPRYGTNQDYRRLADELHKRNMKLIMDVVTNHCGSEHWWMKDLPCTDWVHQFKEFTRSNYQISTSYDPYASEYDKNLDLNGWFDNSMPDLNQTNPLMLTYLVQNTIWWIEFANLDGLRVDTYPYNDPVKMAEWTQAIRKEYPNINIMGECWVHSPQEIAYWQEGTKNPDGFKSTLPTVMDFALHDALSPAFNEKENWNTGVRRFYNHFTLDYVYTHPFNILIFTENHDTQRFNKIIDNDLNKFKIAYTLIFTVRGVPEFYYGSEIMMTGDKDKGDGDIRRDFPGGWPNDQRNAFTSEGRTPQENEAYNFISKLLNWRKNNPVIHFGKTMQFLPQDGCYVYFRYNNEKTVMVIINNNTVSKKINTSRYAERMDGFTSGHEIISGNNITNLSEIELAPKSSMIIELK